MQARGNAYVQWVSCQDYDSKKLASAEITVFVIVYNIYTMYNA